MDYVDSFMLSMIFDERTVSRFHNSLTPRAVIEYSEPLSNFVKQKQPSYVNKLFYCLLIPLTVTSFSVSAVWICFYLRVRQEAVQNIRRIKGIVRSGKFPYQFPAFILFSDNEEFVTETFIPALSNCLRDVFEAVEDIICTEDAHFCYGKAKIKESERCFSLSSAVLVMVTRDFLQDKICRMQVDIACIMGKPLLLFLMDGVNENMLPPLWMKSKIIDMEVRYKNDILFGQIPQDFDYICTLLLDSISKTLL